MKRRILFVNAGGIFVLLLVAVGFAPTKASAQGGPQSILGDLGSKKNGPDDIANSLIAAPPKYGKGEKKEQINSTQLKSKSIKDTTFGGSVLNAGQSLTKSRIALRLPKIPTSPSRPRFEKRSAAIRVNPKLAKKSRHF